MKKSTIHASLWLILKLMLSRVWSTDSTQRTILSINLQINILIAIGIVDTLTMKFVVHNKIDS